MRIILDISDDALKKLGEQADAQKRSRKNYMEFILENTADISKLKFASPEISKLAKGNVEPGNRERTTAIAYKKLSKEAYDSPKLNSMLQDEAWQYPNLKTEEKLVIDEAEIDKRIKELESELKSPPKSPLIGLRMWRSVREQELSKLKKLI